MKIILKILRGIAFIPVAFLALTALFSLFYSSGIYCFGITPVTLTTSVIGFCLQSFWPLWLVCAAVITITTTGLRLLARRQERES